MRSIAHIINPFIVSPKSDLFLAQKMTFASMLRAQAMAKGSVKVELLSAQFEEDRSLVPAGFTKTVDLQRSMLDNGDFTRKMKLPILKDILDRLYNWSNAEFLIFTNVDIGLQPDFYVKVNEMIDKGHDAFIINRRRIPEDFTSTNQLELVYAEPGKKHPGFDCFVFHRSLYPKFALANVCTGVPFIGITLAQNLFCFGVNPKVFTNEFLTFHIGMEIFRKRASRDYFRYNQKQFWSAMSEIWNDLDSRKWPHGNKLLPIRYFLWGINPSLPIRLAFKLEARRWLRKK